MEASESDETVLVLVSLLSGEALAEFAAPKRSTVHDVKTRLRDQEGTPVRKQQLVYGCDILPDTVCLAELGSSDKLELRLVRKEAINFQWQATVGDGNCITSPEWCLDSSEAVSSRRCALSLRYYPTGFESKMLKDGNFSIMVQRPKSSILHARVHIAGVMRERLFTSAHGTLEGWINFASQEVLPTLCCTLEPDFILWCHCPFKKAEMGSSHGSYEPDVPEEIDRKALDGDRWSRRLPWVQSSDFEAHPLDPPLSDAGRAEAKEVGKRIAQFIEAKPGSDIQVVVTSPYLRCIETAAAICLRLGSQTRLMVDLGLGEVYGPEIFGEEPQRTIRSSQEVEEHLKSFADSPDPTAPLRASPSGVTFRPPISTVGVWPTWPETLAMGRRRFAERLLVYISRGAKARRNFLLVSHADCVASCLALMPHGRVVEAVDYGATMMAWRTPLPALLTSPRTAKRIPEPSCLRRSPSGQRAWWGEESCEASTWEKSPEELLSLCRTAWQIETSNVTLGHQWCGQEHAISCARAALRNSEASIQEVDRLLGLLSSDLSRQCPEPKLRRKESKLSCLSYETYLFGCSEKSLGSLDKYEHPVLAPLEERDSQSPKGSPKALDGMLKPIQSRILQRRRGTG
ncbi:Putative E3 ubiquitin-protein ligase HERC1 [Durusdinium trenchii]|uniref:E3 ubiquitin-protein ligase HERC1 n=1 Tax=Durusdinium trenchii TaxID=1381693 RepID=A0ABP0JTE2_9DINO